jgi:sugar lactone lactonase YvrE
MSIRRLARTPEGVRPARWALFIAVTIAVLHANAAFAEPSSIDGLPPGVPLPTWAVGQEIHFEPQRTSVPSSTLGGGGPGEKALAPEVKELKYWGGLAQTTPRVALIFWGKNWTIEPGNALRVELESMFKALPGSGYEKLLSQYSDEFGAISSEGPEIYMNVKDSRVAAPSNVNYEAINKEAEEYEGGKGTPVTYIVFAAPGSKYEAGWGKSFCGYHKSFWGNGEAIAFVPYEGDPPFDEAPKGYLPCTDYAAYGSEPKYNADIATSAAASHEYAESTTDPEPPTGWRTEASEAGEEVADLCENEGAKQTEGGHWVNEVWDDSKKACEIEDRSPGIVEIGPYTDASLEAYENLTPTSVTLNGAIEPCHLEAHYYYEYGKTISYGTKTAEKTLAAQWGIANVPVAVTELKPNTAYHWRVVVRTSHGTEYGGDHQFTTPYSPAVLSKPATGVGASRTTLNGTVNPEGYETKYHFEYGLTTEYGHNTPEVNLGAGTGVLEESAVATYLTPSTKYHFRIVATNAGGTSHGLDETFTTLATGEPFVETSPAKEINETKAAMWGIIDPEGSETQYDFEYGTTLSYGSKTSKESAGSTTSEFDEHRVVSGLSPGTTYHFRMVATNSNGTAYGNDEVFETLYRPTVETQAATGVGETEATPHGVVDPNGTETKYTFEYGTTASYGSKTTEISAGAGTSNVEVSKILTGLWGSTTYHYRIAATNSSGTSYGEDETFTTGSGPPAYLSSFGSEGSGNGQFKHPGGVAVDAKGNVWVLDQGNSRVEEFNEKGEYQKTFGSKGSGSGQLSAPDALAIDAKGNIWVLDTGNDRVEVFNEKGEYQKTFGSLGSGNGQLNTPEGIAIDSHGNVWVSDTANARVEEFNEKGEYVKTVGSKGSGTGQFGEPEGLAVGPGGNIWVTDWVYDRVEEFNEKGEYINQFGSEGSGNGQLSRPYAIDVDANGNAWVADTHNDRVEEFNTKGEYVLQFGAKGTGSNQFEFAYPVGLAISAKEVWRGKLWVTDSGENRIEQWSIPGPTPTYVSSFGSEGTGNGQFDHPGDVGVDSKGNLWVLDTDNDRVEEFNEKDEYQKSFGSKGTTAGHFEEPEALAVDAKNNIWVLDTGNDRVEEFNEKGEYQKKFGSGSQFDFPEGIAIDQSGNIWVSDTYSGCVEEFSEKGTYLKTVGSKGTGAGQLEQPEGIAVGPNGDVWVADWVNNRVEEFNEQGEYLAQFGVEGTGNGQFDKPYGLAVDPNGNVWVADALNARVQELNARGEYLLQFGAKGSGAGQFDYPAGLTLNSKRELWVTDPGDDRVETWR